MAEYSHKRFLFSINGITFDGWDNSADSFSLAPIGDFGAFTNGFGNHVWVDSGDYSETLTFKLMQHHPNNSDMQELVNNYKDNGPTLTNRITFRAYDTINKEEFYATDGRITNGGTLARGNAHNPNTWTIVFPEVSHKLPKG